MFRVGALSSCRVVMNDQCHSGIGRNVEVRLPTAGRDRMEDIGARKGSTQTNQPTPEKTITKNEECRKAPKQPKQNGQWTEKKPWSRLQKI